MKSFDYLVAESYLGALLEVLDGETEIVDVLLKVLTSLGPIALLS
jgi:hypothetical protein